jgi:hypothetical protein
VEYGGRLAPVRRAQLLEDVRRVDAGGLDADDECARDLAIGVAAREQDEDVELARRQSELFREARFFVGDRWD